MKHPREIIDDVLGRGMTNEVWSGNYHKALPITLQKFELSAVLPAVFYMFRFGERRGTGKFLETFGRLGGNSSRERKKAATVKQIASTLSESEDLLGFEDEVSKAILGDLLLCFCLENIKHALGREEQVQRVAPTHYMASWVDLPDKVAHLRHVPEMVVAMLADQPNEYVEMSKEDELTWFPVGNAHEKNALLQAFNEGVKQYGELASRTSDRFDEENGSVGLDQLLMIRLAQQLQHAPDKQRGREGYKISNQHPVAKRAAREFSEDIRWFVRSYSTSIPRRTFVELLESCVSIGLMTILTSTVRLLFNWAETGRIKESTEQKPAHLFVDCSNGVDSRLRALAEESMDDFMRRIERFSTIFMALRLLDYGAKYDSNLKNLGIQTKPDATEWLNLLGDILLDRQPKAQLLLYDLRRKAEELAEHLDSEDYTEAARILRNEKSEPNPVWRLAETLTLLLEKTSSRSKLAPMIDSILLVGHPNCLALKRTTTRATTNASGKSTRRRRDVRSIVFSDSVLDYLVHLYVLRSGNKPGVPSFSFGEFIRMIRRQYGFSVDSAPPGMTISNNLLQSNRAILERRLRDLGLLAGVNDAEAMKHLKPRFEPCGEN